MRACSARKRKARSKIPLTAITTPPRADRVIGGRESKSRIAGRSVGSVDAVFLVSAYAKPLASMWRGATSLRGPWIMHAIFARPNPDPRRTSAHGVYDLQGVPRWMTVAPRAHRSFQVLETNQSLRISDFGNNLISKTCSFWYTYLLNTLQYIILFESLISS